MNGEDIKVSVVIPIYNAYDYLRPALDSVIDQTLREIEIICIDDGSTDHTLELLKEYQKSDSRVRIVTENNAGQSTARNKGLQRARGEYTIFLDADDFFEPELLSELYNLATERSLDIAIAQYDVYNDKEARFERSVDGEFSSVFESGEIVSKSKYPDYIFQSTTGYVWNKLFKTSFLKDKEIFFEPELYVFEDVNFVLTALSMAERISRLDRVLIHHRIYSSQSRPKLFRKYYHQVPAVYVKAKQYLTQHGMYIPLARSFLNMSASRCYKIYNLLWSDAKSDFFDLLHNGYADSLGWYAHGKEAFDSEDVFEFVASVGLYTYAQYEKLQSKERRRKLSGMTSESYNKKLRTAKARERFFNIFKRKKKD